MKNETPSIKQLRDDPLLFCQFFFGVDFAENSGMNRGDIISRNNNVIEVQFKTVII